MKILTCSELINKIIDGISLNLNVFMLKDIIDGCWQFKWLKIVHSAQNAQIKHLKGECVSKCVGFSVFRVVFNILSKKCNYNMNAFLD